MERPDELATLERDLFIGASPEIVFEVVSTPAHILTWWPDSGEIPSEPGAPGWIGFGDLAADGTTVQISIADSVPPRHFSFWWTHEEGSTPHAANANLVSFDLVAEGDGTRLRFTETGFRERGFTDAQAAAHHADHSSGWDHYLPRLVALAEKLGR